MTGKLRCKNHRFEHNRPAHAFKLTKSFPTRPHASRLVQYFVSEIPVNAAKKEGIGSPVLIDGPLTPFSNAKTSLRASITRLYVVHLNVSVSTAISMMRRQRSARKWSRRGEAIHSHLTPGRLSVILHDLPLPCRPVKMSMS